MKKSDLIRQLFEEVSNEGELSSVLSLPFDRKKRLNDLKIENEIELKKAILDNKSLNTDQKIVLNSLISKSLKKFLRQAEILKIAIDNTDDNECTENIDEDWILDFWDKAANISNESTQKIWGKLLAYAASDSRICSKSLLNSLFLMGTEEVTCFINICRFTLSEMHIEDRAEKITAYPIIYFSKNVKKYTVVIC